MAELDNALQAARLARRDRRIERRRLEILDAAARVFAGKGYDAATTHDIADAVDMGESTLYDYFQNKREILIAIINHKKAEVDEFMSQAHLVEDRAGLVQLIDQSMLLWLTRVTFTHTIMGEAWRNPEVFALLQGHLDQLLSLIRDHLELYVKAGQFRAIRTDLTARMILGMFISVLLPAIFRSEPIPTSDQRRQYAEEMTDMLLGGVANPSGQNSF
jgi:AcrR family transcriptional regulator